MPWLRESRQAFSAWSLPVGELLAENRPRDGKQPHIRAQKGLLVSLFESRIASFERANQCLQQHQVAAYDFDCFCLRGLPKGLEQRTERRMFLNAIDNRVGVEIHLAGRREDQRSHAFFSSRRCCS